MRHQTHQPLPGSHGLPLIGETLHLLLDPKFIERRQARHGNIFQSHLLGSPTICMVGPEAARFVLSAESEDHFAWEPGFPDSFKELMGKALFLQDGPEHQRNRGLLMPAFHGQALAGYFEIMNTTITQYLDRWEQQRELSWYDEHKRLNFDIASQILLGAKPGAEVERLSALCTTVTQGLYVPLRSRLPWSRFQRALRARDEILKHLAVVIRERQENPSNDALSLLIQSRDEEGRSLSFRELMVQALFLMFAGHETSSSMITWICLELGRHPEVLARARAEQLELAAQGPLALGQLRQMPYLEQVFKEVERLHPPVLGGFRGVVKEFEFEGHAIPAGTKVYLSILATHRTESIYPDPERFDPERFDPAKPQHKQQAFSLVGFGGGRRICLGMAFAQMEMKLVVAHLLRGYQWDLIPGQRLDKVLFPAPIPRDRLQIYLRHWHAQDAV